MTTYYVGIDLGTSRTSISTSTGKRVTIDTVVGYSKDLVSKKKIGGDYLLGQEAMDNKLSLNMVWPLADGVINTTDPKAIEATSIILKSIINQAIPDRSNTDVIYAAIGVPSQASIQSKKAILEATKLFINKILIVSEPFSVAYGLNRLDECLIVDIGAGTADLLIVKGCLPEDGDQLSLTTAGNYLDNEITKELLKKWPDLQVTPRIVRHIKEKYGFVSDQSDKVLVKIATAGIQGDYDITEILRTCSLRLSDPICAAVQKMVGSFDPEFQGKLRNNVIIAGGGSRLKGIDKAIEKGLMQYGGGEAICVQDSEFSGSNGCLLLSCEIPDEYWEKLV